MTKYGIMAHRRRGKLPDADTWCTNGHGRQLVLDSKEEAEMLAEKYNRSLEQQRGPGRIWYTPQPLMPTDKIAHPTPDWTLESDGSLTMGGQVVVGINQLGPDNASREERLANAYLIVNAPKLLKQLAEVVELLELEQKSKSDKAVNWPEWVVEARVLISEALGELPGSRQEG